MTNWSTMYDSGALDRARDNLARIDAQMTATRKAIADARCAVTVAQERRQQLVDRAANDGNVPAAEITQAAQAVADAQAALTFATDTAASLSQQWGAAQSAIGEAQSAGGLPIARAAAAARLAASQKLAGAQAALAAAEAEYDHATVGLQIASGAGWRAPPDIAAALFVQSRQPTLEEKSRMIPIRHAPDREADLLRRARLLP